MLSALTSGWAAWAYVASEWIIRLAMIPVLMRKRSPSAAAAWLAVIFFLPWAGLALYLVVGEPRLGRRRHRRHVEAIRTVRSRHRLEKLAPFERIARIPPAHRDIARLAQRIADLPPTGGSRCELLAESERVVERLVADIDAAARHVHITMFIFRSDETGRTVAAALRRAAKRGVSCRLLVDAVGSRAMLKTLAPSLRKSGVDVRAFFPVRLYRVALERLDLRNHRKLAVIDGRIGWAGSQNIVDADYGERRFGPWRDVMARFEGSAALQLQYVFLEDWCAQTGAALEGDDLYPDVEATGSVSVQTAPSGPGPRSDGFTDLIIATLNEAQRRVVMTTPYFVPDEPLLTTLRVLALRGVEVDLVIPARSNHPLASAAGRAYLGELLRAGVRIHRHHNGLLHAKTISVDNDLALVGSGNFDIRSFSLNYELTQALYGGDIARSLRDVQGAYMADATEMTLDDWRRRSPARRLFDDFAKLLSPIL